MDLIPLTAHTYHEMDGNSICESVYLGVVPAQPPGPGILGHLLRRMCPPQGPDLAVGFTPASRWGGGGGGTDQEPLCPVKRLHMWGVERDVS